MFRTLLLFALTLTVCCQVSDAVGQLPVPGKKVGPDYVRPAAQTAPQWIDFNHPNLINATHATEDQQWWQVFGDPEIDRLVDLCHRQNLPIQAALLRIQQSQFERAVAVGNLFPQNQQLSADYQRIQFSQNGTPFGVAGLGQRSFDLFDLGFNASWEMDLWGRLRRTIEAADAKVGVTQEDRCDVKLSMTAEVVSAYTEIRIYQQRIANALEQIEAQKKTLKIAKAKYNNGSTSNLDVSQADAVLQVTQAGLTELEAGLRATSNRLCLLLGIPPQELTPDIGFGGIPETPELIQVGVPCDLIRRRPDVRRAEREVAAQSALIGVAKADLYPAFTLSGAVNWQSFAFSELFQSSSQAGTLVPGIRWDILNYGRIKNRIRGQEARFMESVVNYRQTVLNANAEAETALSNYLKKKEQIAYLQQAVLATQQAVDTSRKQYEGGVIEFDRLNDSQKSLVTQKDELAFHKGQAALLLINVYKTMGGGWSLQTCAALEQEAGWEEVVLPAADEQAQTTNQLQANSNTRVAVDASDAATVVAFDQSVNDNRNSDLWQEPVHQISANQPNHVPTFLPVKQTAEPKPESRLTNTPRESKSLWKQTSTVHPKLWSTETAKPSMNPLWQHTRDSAQEPKSAAVYSHYDKSKTRVDDSSRKLWR